MGSNDIIALVGIAATFIVSVANLIDSLRNNKRTIFVNTLIGLRDATGGLSQKEWNRVKHESEGRHAMNR
jgi:hypothetical protein